MFMPPVQCYDDEGFGLLPSQGRYAVQERVERFLADAGFPWQIGEILEREAQGGQQEHVPRQAVEHNGSGGLLLVGAGSHGCHACPSYILPSVFQSPPSLVNAVVVGKVEVGEAVPAQYVQLNGIAAEDEPFVVGLPDFRCRALQVSHHDLAAVQQRVNGRCKEPVEAEAVDGLPNAAVQEDVAGEGDSQYGSGVVLTMQ